jgi:hypothetical protein
VKTPLPATPWIESPDLETHLSTAGLEPDIAAKLRAFAASGFVVLDLGPDGAELCDRAIAQTERRFGPSVRRVQDAWLRAPAVRQLALHPTINAFLRAAYGREPFPFQTLSFRTGSEQPLHADTIHFHSVPERFMCGVWFALEDVKPDAGPLIYHVGSHRLPVMTLQDAGLIGRSRPAAYEEHYLPAFQRRIAESGLPQERALIRKGQAFMWAANLAHGGAPITREGATRRSLVAHYYFEGCLYHTPLQADGPRLRLRAPSDLRTGLWRWPKRDGRIVLPGLRQTLGAVGRSVFRRPLVG